MPSRLADCAPATAGGAAAAPHTQSATTDWESSGPHPSDHVAALLQSSMTEISLEGVRAALRRAVRMFAQDGMEGGWTRGETRSILRRHAAFAGRMRSQQQTEPPPPQVLTAAVACRFPFPRSVFSCVLSDGREAAAARVTGRSGAAAGGPGHAGLRGAGPHPSVAGRARAAVCSPRRGRSGRSSLVAAADGLQRGTPLELLLPCGQGRQPLRQQPRCCQPRCVSSAQQHPTSPAVRSIVVPSR